MIDTVKGSENLKPKIGSSATKKVVAKGTNVNYDLSKVDAPYLSEFCQYLADAIKKLSSNQPYRQSNLVDELGDSLDTMEENLKKIIQGFKEGKTSVSVPTQQLK